MAFINEVKYDWFLKCTKLCLVGEKDISRGVYFSLKVENVSWLVLINTVGPNKVCKEVDHEQEKLSPIWKVMN